MIGMNDFKSEPSELKDSMLQAVKRVFDSGWYVLVPELEAFEHAWADTCGVKFGVGVGNGTDAIELSLRAAGIGPGDEVITTSMSAFATVLAILRTGATPVLADIDSDTGLLSIDSSGRCLSGKSKAVLLVHLFGQIRNMTGWIDFCKNHDLLLFEDCAQAHLAQFGSGYAGSFGKAGADSFYPTKNLGAIGDAGMIVTNDENLAALAKQLRNYGQSERYVHPLAGMNSRLDEIQAAILSSRLNWLERFTARRQEIAILYNQNIRNSKITLFNSGDPNSHSYHLYVVRCESRDALKEYLLSNGIETNLHYPLSLTHQESLRDIRTDARGVPNSISHAQSCISLPCHPQMRDSDVWNVINAVNMY
jgi:dTDP-4-amino-4,6-dideoxygalactose transaminase